MPDKRVDALAGKVRDLGVDLKAVGMPWFTRENFQECLALFNDTANFPDTFDSWLAQSEALEKSACDKGMRVIRVEIDPHALSAWCRAKGLSQIDANVRQLYCGFRAMEIDQQGKS